VRVMTSRSLLPPAAHHALPTNTHGMRRPPHRHPPREELVGPALHHALGKELKLVNVQVAVAVCVKGAEGGLDLIAGRGVLGVLDRSVCLARVRVVVGGPACDD
jgi:hypothetical protein